MEETANSLTEEGVVECPPIENKGLMELFHERDLSQEEVDSVERGVKEGVLKALGQNPLCASYLYPRSSQVDECNNSDLGDGLLRRYIFNTNTIIKSLNTHLGIGEPPTKFKK